MSEADLAGLAFFVLCVFLASGYMLFVSASAETPAGRVTERMQRISKEYGENAAAGDTGEATEAVVMRSEGHPFAKLAAKILEWIKSTDPKLVAGVLLSMAALGGLGLGVARLLLDLPLPLQVAAAFGGGAMSLVFALPALVEARNRKFLDAFPDALDFIIRSVRAGIPVSQALGLAAKEVDEPLAKEFKTISDSLAVGIEMKDAFEGACRRINVSDFNFFAVTLVLQRDTGGPLTETLENLGTIIRQRREIRMKARSLTAEGRATAKIIGALPLCILGAVYWLNPDYMMLLFTEPLGRKILTGAGMLLLFGMLVVNRMTKLKT